MQRCVGRANRVQTVGCSHHGVAQPPGQPSGCDAAMCLAEMTRHRFAIGILQPLARYAGVRQRMSPNAKTFHFSVLLKSDLRGHLPPLTPVTVATAQAVSNHAADAVA
jgi:hypothetical protein